MPKIKKITKFYVPCFARKVFNYKKLWDMIWDRSGYVTRGVLITITVDKYVVKKSFYSAYYGSSWSISDALLWILRNLRTPILKNICERLLLLSAGVYMRFHFGRNEIFQFGVWSISYNCLYEIHVISLRSFWQKWNFISGNKCYVNTTFKWNHSKGNICTCEYFIKTKIVDQKIKTKISFISFRPQWKLI